MHTAWTIYDHPFQRKNPGAALPSAAILILSNSASCKRFVLALLFWNQIFTWISVNLKDEENSARSAMLRYCFSLNFFSRERSCWVVKGVRGFLLGLCFLRLHFIRRGSWLSATKKEKYKLFFKIILCSIFNYEILKTKLLIKSLKKYIFQKHMLKTYLYFKLRNFQVTSFSQKYNIYWNIEIISSFQNENCVFLLSFCNFQKKLRN